MKLFSRPVLLTSAILATTAAIAAQTVTDKAAIIDAKSGATQVDYDNPYLVSNQETIFDSSGTQSNPHFTTTAEAIPTANNDTLKSFFIKNTGNLSGGAMERKCTLRGSLAEAGSERLAIDVWVNDNPMTASSDTSLQPTANSFVYVKTNDVTREIRYSLSYDQQIEVAVGCQSAVPGNYTVQLKCTGADRGDTIFTYTDSRIWCSVGDKVTAPILLKDSFEQ